MTSLSTTVLLDNNIHLHFTKRQHNQRIEKKKENNTSSSDIIVVNLSSYAVAFRATFSLPTKLDYCHPS